MFSGTRYAPLNQSHAKVQTEQQFRASTAEVSAAKLDRQALETAPRQPDAGSEFSTAARTERQERARARPLIVEATSPSGTGAKTEPDRAAPSPTRPHPAVAPVATSPDQLALGSTTRLYQWGTLRAARADDPTSLERPARGETSKHFEWRRMVNARMASESARETAMQQKHPRPTEIDKPLGEKTEARKTPFGQIIKPDKAPEKAAPEPEI